MSDALPPALPPAPPAPSSAAPLAWLTPGHSRDVGAQYTRRVRFLKKFLPALALLLLALVVLWPTLQERGLQKNLEQAALALALATPRFSGVDAHGRPYLLEAAQATQIRPAMQEGGVGLIDLAAPRGEITLRDGRWLSARAARGEFDSDRGQLVLMGDVEIFRDDGVSFHTERAALDVEAEMAVGDAPARLQGPFGMVEGAGFAVLDGGAVVQFRGPARALLNLAPPTPPRPLPPNPPSE